MSSATYLKKPQEEIQNVVVVYPFTYIAPYYALPPVAAEYLQAGILETGRNAVLFDMRYEIDIKEHLQTADLVCVYGYYEDCSIFVDSSKHVIEEILSQIPEETPIVAGGTRFSDDEEALNKYPSVDVIIMGNPETCIMELLKGKKLEDIDNLAFRKDGEINKTRRIVHALPEDVYPRRKHRNPKYNYHAVGIKVDLIKAGVGCNYKCRFCYQYGKDFDGSFRSWQGRSAQSLYNEISEIEGTMIGWVDDDMTTDMQTLDDLSTLLIDNGVKKMWFGTGRIDHILKHVDRVNPNVLPKLEKAGLLGLNFGVESLNQKTLKFYGKGQSLDSVEKAMRLMQKTNILMLCSFIFGSPGETEEDMMDMLKFGRRWRLDNIVTNRFRVLEGTSMWDAIYDQDTGKVKPGMELITDEELADIKYKVKFGQRTPLQIILTLLKMYRHKGMALDPTYIFLSAIESVIKGSVVQKTLIIPALLKATKFFVALPVVRQIARLIAIILTPIALLLNALLEAIDSRLEISIKVLPKIMRKWHDDLYERQKAQVQVRNAE